MGKMANKAGLAQMNESFLKAIKTKTSKTYELVMLSIFAKAYLIDFSHSNIVILTV